MTQMLGGCRRAALQADFLQVPHHGRSSSALPAFYEDVRPQVAVVSQAGEPYHRGGEDLCRQTCHQVLSTEDSGAVLVELRQRGCVVKTFLRASHAERP